MTEPTEPTNPLDDLAQFDPSDLPRAHTSGRRELKQQWLDRGITLRVQPRTEAEKLKAMVGEWIDSAPIRRAEPKRPEGISARQWKRMKREGK